VFRSALGDHAGVVEYQVRQTERGARIAVRCAGPVDLDRLSDDIASGLAALGVRRPAIEIVAVERLERDPGPAKLRRFVPLGPEAGDRAPALAAAV
jgi:hypothetical protein